MTWYKNRRAKGLCVNCQNPSESFRCEECGKRENERIRLMRQARGKAGLCIKCGITKASCVCKKPEPKLLPQQSIIQAIADAVSGIDLTNAFGRLDLIEAIEGEFKRFGLPQEKRPRYK